MTATNLLTEGDRIKIDGQLGTVIDVLSTQYFVEFDNGDERFYFQNELSKKDIMDEG